MDIPRLMGLVVALRFLSWGVGCLSLSGMVGLWSSHIGYSMISPLALAVLFGVYLILTGSFLMVWRLQGWVRKLLACSPILAILLASLSESGGTLVPLTWILSIGLALSWSALRSQASVLGHSKTTVLGTWGLGTLFTALVVFTFWPEPFFVFVAAGVMVVANWLFWQVWLRELRHSILTYEDLGHVPS